MFVEEELIPGEKTERWVQAFNSLTRETGPLLRQLENDFRGYLRGDVPTS